jgi:hypothetical protein
VYLAQDVACVTPASSSCVVASSKVAFGSCLLIALYCALLHSGALTFNCSVMGFAVLPCYVLRCAAVLSPPLIHSFSCWPQQQGCRASSRSMSAQYKAWPSRVYCCSRTCRACWDRRLLQGPCLGRRGS